MEKVNFNLCHWMNEPRYYIQKENELIIETEPFTNLWSETYYGKNASNAPILYFHSVQDGTVMVKCEFRFFNKYDQCGLVVYITEDCWFKINVEAKDEVFHRLSTVVTMNGYSDWSSSNISSGISVMYFRLHRRGFFFKVENSYDGVHFKQMRIFHLNPLGQPLRVGVFACSPLDSSFDATFSQFCFEDCLWEQYKGE